MKAIFNENTVAQILTPVDGFDLEDCFHKDAVIVFASGTNKSSVPIATALEIWKQGFKNNRKRNSYSWVKWIYWIC